MPDVSMVFFSCYIHAWYTPDKSDMDIAAEKSGMDTATEAYP
jgi:hypothetical protein